MVRNVNMCGTSLQTEEVLGGKPVETVMLVGMYGRSSDEVRTPSDYPLINTVYYQPGKEQGNE